MSLTPNDIKKYCFIAALAGLNLGIDIGSIGSLVTSFNSFKAQYPNLSDFNTGVVISMLNLGGLFGGLFFAKVDNYRFNDIKFMICLNLGIVLLGQFVQIYGFQSWQMFTLGRFIFGLGQGGNNVLCPLYISQVCTIFNQLVGLNIQKPVGKSKMSYFQLMITLGICCGNISNYIYKTYIQNTFWQWRMPILTNFLVTTTMFNLMYWCSPSPNDMQQQVNNKLVKLFSTYNKNDMFEIESFNEKPIKTTRTNIKENAFKKMWNGQPLYLWRVTIGCLILIFQQFTGINYFFYYSSLIFNNIRHVPIDLIKISFSIINFLATLASFSIIKRWSPKKVLLTGYIGCCTNMFIFSSLGLVQNITSSSNSLITILMACSTAVFITFFALFIGPITFIIIDAVLPRESEVKTLGFGISNSFSWTTSFLIGTLTPTMNTLIGMNYGYIFCGITVVGIIFQYINLPDLFSINENEREEKWREIQNKRK